MMNVTFLVRTGSMSSNSSLEKQCWGEDVNTTCYLVNFYLSTAIEFKNLVEAWLDRLTNNFTLRIFECLVYYHVDNGKFERKSRKGMFVSYGLKWRVLEFGHLAKEMMIFDRGVILKSLWPKGHLRRHQDTWMVSQR